MKPMQLGGGGKFEKLTDKLQDQGKSAQSAEAIAAAIGRKKYGAPKMEQMAKKGSLKQAMLGGK